MFLRSLSLSLGKYKDIESREITEGLVIKGDLLSIVFQLIARNQKKAGILTMLRSKGRDVNHQLMEAQARAKYLTSESKEELSLS